jgi:predicted PurR-regulated permease PerM
VSLDRTFLLRLLAALAGLFVAAALLYVALPILRDLFAVGVTLGVTAIVALLINPVVDRFERRRVPRGVTVMGIYALVTIAAGIVAVLVLRPLTDQLGSLSTNSTEVVVSVGDGAKQLLGPGASIEVIGLQTQQVAGGLSQTAGALRGSLAALGDLLIDLMLVGVLTLFLVTDLSLGRSLLRTTVPAAQRERAARTVGAISVGLSRWLGAQLCISLYYAVTYTIVNVALGIPYAVTIGVVSGLLEFIPYLGGIVGLIMTLLAALTVSPQTAVWAFILGAVIGIIGGNFVGPFLLGKAAQVHPALVIIALLIGGVFGGALGVLLAMPVTVIIVILLQELRRTGQVDAAIAAGQAAVAAGQAAVASLRERPAGDDPTGPPGPV